MHVDGKDGIIAGHGRFRAAQRLNLAQVPVIVLDHLSDAERRAYIIADNKLAENAEWDAEILTAELAALNDEEFDLGVIGFSDRELERMLNAGDDPRADECPEVQPDAITQRGDLWVLGRHRVLCGDATKADDVVRLMGGKRCDVVLTDPPYGLGDTVSDKNNYDVYDDTRDRLIETIALVFPIFRSLAHRIVLTPGNRNQYLYPPPTWMMAWFIPAGIGMGPWGFCCWQPILCYGKDPKLASGEGSWPDALVHTETSEQFGHPCTKPIKFWQWLMDRTCELRATVYDSFAGSGTTLIASEKTNRTCFGMELSPSYCDVIVRRWQDYTGQAATLDGGGRTFDEVAQSRGKGV